MNREIVVTLWTGAVPVRPLAPDDPDPTQAELDELATAWTAHNDGIRPVVRVLEESANPGRRVGAAGTVPR